MLSALSPLCKVSGRAKKGVADQKGSPGLGGMGGGVCGVCALHQTAVTHGNPAPSPRPRLTEPFEGLMHRAPVFTGQFVGQARFYLGLLGGVGWAWWRGRDPGGRLFFNSMFYQLLCVQHSCSSTQSWGSVLPSIVETRDQNSRGCPLLFSNRNLGSFCA